MADLPELTEEQPATISELEIPSLLQQLAQIGFKVPQARNAIEFLSKPSPFAQGLVQSLAPLEACIEYRQYIHIHINVSD
jgi:ATP-dependent RNA helicase DHX57